MIYLAKNTIGHILFRCVFSVNLMGKFLSKSNYQSTLSKYSTQLKISFSFPFIFRVDVKRVKRLTAIIDNTFNSFKESFFNNWKKYNASTFLNEKWASEQNKRMRVPFVPLPLDCLWAQSFSNIQEIYI